MGLVLSPFFDFSLDILGAALVLELLWLDVFPIGTVIPPNRLLALLLTILIGVVFDLRGAGEFLLPLGLFLLAAPLCCSLEAWNRRRQNSANVLLHDWANQGDPRDIPALLMLRGAVLFFVSHAVLFIALFLMTMLFVQLWNWYLPESTYASISTRYWPGLSWTWVCLAAGVGGFLSLRLQHARFLFACLFVVFTSALAIAGICF